MPSNMRGGIPFRNANRVLAEGPPAAKRAGKLELPQAGPEDIPFLARELTRLRLDKEDLHPDQFLLLRREGEIIAFGRIKSYAGVHEMASLAVLEPYRRHGFGKLVAQGLIDRCPGDTIYLVTDIPSFFEKLGFVITEDIPPVILEKKEKFCTQYSSGPVVAMVLRKERGGN